MTLGCIVLACIRNGQTLVLVACDADLKRAYFVVSTHLQPWSIFHAPNMEDLNNQSRIQANEEEEDLEAWAASEGIPRAADPFIQKYFQGRDALFAQEDKHRSGS